MNRGGAVAYAGASNGDDGAEGAIALQVGRGASRLTMSGARRSGGAVVSAGRGTAALVRHGGSAAHRGTREVRRTVEKTAEQAVRVVRQAAFRTARAAQAVAGAVGGQALVAVAGIMAVALVLVAVMS